MTISTLQGIYVPIQSSNLTDASFLDALYATPPVSLYEAIDSYVSLKYIGAMREEVFTATSNQTAFTITYSAPAVSGTFVPLRVYRNGARLKYVASGPAAGQFTYSGTTVTTSSSTASDVIIVEYLQ